MPDIDHITLGHARTLLENMEQNVDRKDAQMEAKMRQMDAENDSQLEAHLRVSTNPHGITKEQVGLGNVPNVSTNDQTPTYAESEELSHLQSGEKMNTAFGKLKKAVSTLIAHLGNKSNPHNVTAAQLGAEPAGAASASVGSHNTSATAHADIRNTLSALLSQVDALDDSTDPSMDQMSEVVAFIRENRSMIAAFAEEVDDTQAVQVALAVSAWNVNADAVTVAAGLNYYADAVVVELTESDGTETILDVASLETARACGMCATSVSLEGAVRYYARSIPTADITATVRIHKNIEE